MNGDKGQSERSCGERKGCQACGELEKLNNLCLKITIYFEFIIYVINYMSCVAFN